MRIDGPYSTASCRIFDSEQVILIAGGIGVTPFASILQSLWFKYINALKTCTKCKHQWYEKLDRNNNSNNNQNKLKQVDFIWVNRDYNSFEWFIELLGELELQQLKSERFIHIHLYMTSARDEQIVKIIDRPEFNRHGQIEAKISNNFAMKLFPGRPNIDKV